MSLVELGGIAAVGFGVGLYPGIRHLVEFKRIERKWGPPEAVGFLGERLSQAKQSVDVVVDGLNPFVFDPLTPLITRQLEEKPKLKLRLITSPSILGLRPSPSEPPRNQLLELAKSDRFGEQLQVRTAESPQGDNFGLIDTTHFYIEEQHSPEDISFGVTIHINSAFPVAKLQSEFEEMWKAARELPASQIEVIPHSLELTNPEEARRIIKEVESLPLLQAA